MSVSSNEASLSTKLSLN